MKDEIKWSEKKIQQAIRMVLFKGAFTMCPNCNFSGSESDLLIVDKSLRLIDIEIKISRSDFKADYKKDKWWDNIFMPSVLHGPPNLRSHPKRIWKHYYCIPLSIWEESLIDSMPSKNSGIILISSDPRKKEFVPQVSLRHLPKPNKNADVLTKEEVFSIARLGNFRMWNALVELERIKANQLNQ